MFKWVNVRYYYALVLSCWTKKHTVIALLLMSNYVAIRLWACALSSAPRRAWTLSFTLQFARVYVCVWRFNRWLLFSDSTRVATGLHITQEFVSSEFWKGIILLIKRLRNISTLKRARFVRESGMPSVRWCFSARGLRFRSSTIQKDAGGKCLSTERTRFVKKR